MQANQVTPVLAYHMEGPVWWATTGEMRLLDMLAGVVICLTADGEPRRLEVGSRVVACLRPRTAGGAIVARERDFAIADTDDLSDLRSLTGDIVPLGLRFNEGNCDPAGRFYCGTMAYDRTVGVASLLVLEPGETTIRSVLEGVTISNGLGFSPDGATAYYVDTPQMRIDTLDYDPQSGLTARRPFAKFQEDDGHPDGLCVDSEGGVWVAMNKAGHIRRYDPRGHQDGRVDVGALQVTACAFGNDDLATLYITTSRENLPAKADPNAGALFAVQPGITGQPPLPFRG